MRIQRMVHVASAVGALRSAVAVYRDAQELREVGRLGVVELFSSRRIEEHHFTRSRIDGLGNYVGDDSRILTRESSAVASAESPIK